jgi:hypothetical protein
MKDSHYPRDNVCHCSRRHVTLEDHMDWMSVFTGLTVADHPLECLTCFGWGGTSDEPCERCEGQGLTPVPHSEFYGRKQ